MATERNMLAALERTRAYRLEGGELVLLDGAGVQAARFIAE
jgi:heat shock protein HslJ